MHVADFRHKIKTDGEIDYIRNARESVGSRVKR